MYRLSIKTLLRVAQQNGDSTRHAIHRSTGVSQSSIYRFIDGTTQPDLNSILRIAKTYGVTVEDLMEPIEAEAAA